MLRVNDNGEDGVPSRGGCVSRSSNFARSPTSREPLPACGERLREKGQSNSVEMLTERETLISALQRLEHMVIRFSRYYVMDELPSTVIHGRLSHLPTILGPLTTKPKAFMMD